MVFVLLFARKAGKVRFKGKAAALGTLLRTTLFVILMSMLANARCTPLVYVKSFASHQPVHANFFGTSRDVAEFFASTRFASRFNFSLFRHCNCML